MHLAIAAMYLLLTIVIIFGVAWAICYVLAHYAPQVPAQVQSFVWLVAAILVIIKLIFFLGLVPGYAAEAPTRAPVAVERNHPPGHDPRDLDGHIDRGIKDGGLHRDVQPFNGYHGQPCVRRLPLLVCQPH